jgi:hypothetical protein
MFRQLPETLNLKPVDIVDAVPTARRFVSPETLAQLWDLRAARVRELCRQPSFPARLIGPNTWRIDLRAAEAWWDARPEVAA